LTSESGFSEPPCGRGPETRVCTRKNVIGKGNGMTFVRIWNPDTNAVEYTVRDIWDVAAVLRDLAARPGVDWVATGTYIHAATILEKVKVIHDKF
jgi:hypothetical protein